MPHLELDCDLTKEDAGSSLGLEFRITYRDQMKYADSCRYQKANRYVELYWKQGSHTIRVNRFDSDQ